MQLAEMQIENFRSFKNEVIHFDDYTCFVGANGAGKSTILTALNVFFRNNDAVMTDICKLSEEDFHHKNTKKPVKITLTFEDLSPEEQEEFKHYYRQGKLVLFAKAEWNQDKQFAEVKQHGSRMVIDDFTVYFEADDRKTKAAELKEIYKGIQKDYPDLPDENVKDKMQDALLLYQESHKDLCVMKDDPANLYGWTKGINKLKKYIEWVYVPAVKDASSEQDETSKTALGQLLSRTIRAKIDFEKPIGELKAEVELRYKDLIKKEEVVLQDISLSLQKRLRDWTNPSSNLELKWHYDQDKTIKIEEPAARVSIGEGKFQGEIARLGHGMQRAFLLSILQELAGSDQDRNPRLILSIEEPELYQHPPQAQHMANLLLELTSDEKNKTQIIASTHSPYFVSCENFENIRMVRKNYHGEMSSVTGTNYEKLEKRISSALGEKPGSPTSLMARVNQIMFPSQSELFFSSLPIIVEGIEDVAYISTQFALSEQLDNFKKYGCHFIIAGGKNKISRLVAIALELSQPVFVVFDADNNNKGQTNINDNSCILNLIGIKDYDPLPSETLLEKNLVMWPTNLTEVIKSEFDGEWEAVSVKVRKKYGYTDGVRGKNKMLIAAALEETFGNGKQSPSLIKVCGSILRYAEGVNCNDAAKP